MIGKRRKFGLFGRTNYFISVHYDENFDRLGHDKLEYQVEEDLFDDVILGAYVKGDFEQIPEGLKPMYLF